jgi:hypothetical protein
MGNKTSCSSRKVNRRQSHKKDKRGGGLSPLSPGPKIAMRENIHKKIKTMKKVKKSKQGPTKTKKITSLRMGVLIQEAKRVHRKKSINRNFKVTN